MTGRYWGEFASDTLGRVVESVETPSEDTTEYEYWASGRLKKEERKGEVAYSREYAYNPDGSRDSVIRDDALNGSFWEVYVYNETSGRLESVMDIWTSDTHEFAWNPEGTLARWTDPNADYERVFSYDEEGRLTKIERDDGQSVETAYEYTYTGDGIRHMKKDHLSEKEYRYGCSLDCGGTPLRVYSRELGSQGEWNSVEDYMNAPTFVWYNHSGGGSSDYAWLPGHWISDLEPPGEGSMFYQDACGVQVVAGDFAPQAPMKRLPEYLHIMDSTHLVPFGLVFSNFSSQSQNRDCDNNEFKKCKEYCKGQGGFYVGCFWEGGVLNCLCGFPPDKPCSASEVSGCRSRCTGQGLRYAGCVRRNGGAQCICR